MAHTHMGSNNINLLMPNGQFGTRLQGGKDSASPRYIFTELNSLTPLLFHPDDSPLLKYLDDDGQMIEPQYYVPVLPLLLINGSEGIGTGFSTNIPCYNPKDIAANLQKIMDGEPMQAMHPWYRGFTGVISQKDDTSYVSKGVYSIDGDVMTITELPLKMWTDDYKKFLENCLVDSAADKKAKTQFLVSYENHSTESTVKFILHFVKGVLTKRAADPEALEADLKLTRNISTGNMHMYDAECSIRKYADAQEVLAAFYQVRLKLYSSRRDFILKSWTRDLSILSNKVRFIEGIMNDELVIFRKPKDDVISLLEKGGFDRFDTDADVFLDNPDVDGSYSYLINMPIHSFTAERIQELLKQRASKQADIAALQSKTALDLWKADISKFMTAYESELTHFQESREAEASQKVIEKRQRKKQKIKK